MGVGGQGLGAGSGVGGVCVCGGGGGGVVVEGGGGVVVEGGGGRGGDSQYTFLCPPPRTLSSVLFMCCFWLYKNTMSE